MHYTRVIFTFIVYLFSDTALYAHKTLIVELDEVLFTAQKSSAGVKLGKYTPDYYIKRLFDIVATLEVPYTPRTQVLYKKYVMPPAWCLYLLNYYTSKTMYERVTEAIKKQVAWFWPERAILLHAASIAFDPQKEVEHLVPLVHVHALISQCVRKSNIQLIVFSNKNTETLAALQQKYPELFTLCKYTCVSGTLGQLKPSKQAYKLLLEKYKLDPTKCYVIDTKQENLVAAQDLGMISIVYENNSTTLRNQLVHHKIL